MVTVVIVSHEIQSGRMEEAKARIDSNGARMAEAEGFISRITVVPRDGSNFLSTVTQWSEFADYTNWQEENRKSNVHAGSESPYVGSPNTQIYECVSLRTKLGD